MSIHNKKTLEVYQKVANNYLEITKLANSTYKENAIYDKKIVCLAEIYLKRHIYSQKLILTLLQINDYDNNIYLNPYDPDDITQIINDLYKQIEIEFEKQDNKKEYAYMIKNSFKKIIIPKSIKNSHISSNYNWIKVLK